MEVRVKYELVSRSTISSISYNQQFGILSVVADGNDTAAFFSVETNELTLANRFGGQSKPSSSGYVSWSPNGLLIAVANVKVELWKFEAMKLAPLRIINQGFIEIKNIGWSQDSKYYLCYGVNPKDTPLSINIRQIQSNELRQIITEDPPILANFDPFGKYIVVLTLKNSLNIYDSHTLDKIKSISFAETKHDLPTLKDRRTGDWSPEYSYFACPNLNDSRVSTALILDRNKSFAVKQILVGHQATISCTKFNPHIFQHELDKTFILAVGDSSGCVSIWRIGKNKTPKQPLFIISSPNKAEQSIEGVEWNSEGNLLIVNVLKKYVMLVSFRLEDFGRKLSDPQKSSLIVSTYGVSGANQIAGARLEVFGQQDHSMVQQNKFAQPTIINYENNFGVQEKPKQRLVKTEQQVIIKKGQKKRIIPSMYVPESEVVRKTQSITNSTQPVQLNNGNRVWDKPKLPSLNLPNMKQEIKRQYALRDHILNVQNSKNVTILSTKDRNWRSSQKAQNKRLFNGQLKLIHVTHSYILVIANDKLFVFDFNLKLIELPCFLGNISHFTANNSGTVYYMTTNGFIRGFNYIKHESICETSAAYLLLSESINQVTTNPFSMFLVFDDDNDKLHVELKNSLDRYFFCKQSNSWIQFDFNQGFYLPGHSLRISKTDVQTASNFYNNLVAPALLLKNRQNESAVSEYELQVLYYGKYSKDSSKFKDALLKMFADLKAKGNDDQLRKQIIKYFIDKNSTSYLNDRDLWTKVVRIGGRVIEQFMMLQKF